MNAVRGICKATSQRLNKCVATLTTGVYALGFGLPGFAQVTSDGTTSTLVNQSGSLIEILNGRQVGNNLFHSFRDFSVSDGMKAQFNLNNTSITTIFSRVTGGNVSHIDGTISIVGNPSASLFLLNPAGIIFGKDAELQIGGSFVGTTANSIKFSDGTEFSAVNPTSTSLLRMSVPIGLQMGQNAGGITVQGSGHRLTLGDFAPTNRNNNPVGLQIKGGNTFALIGGEVNFVGGIVTVNGGGHLEVGSVSDGQVTLNRTLTGWVGDYSAVRQFNDIHLAQQSMLDASGSRGSIQLQGQNINLTEGSAALIQNFGTQDFEGITVKATESLNLTGNTLDRKLGSLIKIDNLGSGQTGDITISAAQLSVKNAAQLSNQTFAKAPGGNIRINVTGSIHVDGFAPAKPTVSSVITTTTFNSNNAGNITISTDNLMILNSGSIASVTVGSGQAGMVQVNAKDLIEIAGNNPITLKPSTLTSTTLISGNANNLFVNTSRLVLRDGASLGSNTVLVQQVV
jgi:filamentous hemagglutinin family protein